MERFNLIEIFQLWLAGYRIKCDKAHKNIGDKEVIILKQSKKIVKRYVGIYSHSIFHEETLNSVINIISNLERLTKNNESGGKIEA